MIKQLLVHNPFKWNDGMSYLAAIIRWRTGKHYNHTGLLVPIEGEIYLVHAIFPKVQIIRLDKWLELKSDRGLKTEDLEYNPEVSTVHTALEYVGRNYNWKGLVQMFIYLTFGIWLGKSNRDEVYCYQLVEKWRGNKEAYKAIPRLKTNNTK